MADAAARMDTLSRRRQAAEAKLEARAEDLSPILPVIQRLSLYPAETMLALPAAPDDALRGVWSCMGSPREIEEQATALRREQAEVDAAAAAMQAEAPKLAVGRVRPGRAGRGAATGQLAGARQPRASRGRGRGRRPPGRRTGRARRQPAGRHRAIEAQRSAGEAQPREEAARAERQQRAATQFAARGGKTPWPGRRAPAARRSAAARPADRPGGGDRSSRLG